MSLKMKNKIFYLPIIKFKAENNNDIYFILLTLAPTAISTLFKNRKRRNQN